MSLISADGYDQLSGVSSSQQKKVPGKFSAVFITGASREGQEIGKLQCMSDMDNGKYLLQNKEEVRFIPYFIKRFWAKYVETTSQSGDKYQKCVAFGWSDDIPKIDDE